MFYFNAKLRILHFFKINIVGVISANVRFTNSHKFPPREKVTPKKANTCIERKVYYAGVFCKISLYERPSGDPRGSRS